MHNQVPHSIQFFSDDILMAGTNYKGATMVSSRESKTNSMSAETIHQTAGVGLDYLSMNSMKHPFCTHDDLIKSW